ncbi:hypothetical protein LINPERHAP2_LOCUS41824 [Linum perenne]
MCLRKPIMGLIIWLILVTLFISGCTCFRNRTLLWLIG